MFSHHQTKAARVGSKEPTNPNFPGGNVHQQHQRHAVQEGQLRSGRSDLSRCHQVSQPQLLQKSKLQISPFQVRRSIWRRFLEQLALLHDAISLSDDDLVGDRL